MERKVAVVGMECVFPDAENYLQLWENIIHGRKAFRKIPEERLNKNYFTEAVDGIYQNRAGLITNYHFDREKYKIPLETFESTDFCHWMALDIASKAIENSGIQLDAELRKSTGVFIGNSLTGEQTRSNLLRLRWPYVFDVLNDQLENVDWSEEKKKEFLNDIEKKYKSSFPSMKEDSLAGGLSNTIAGRICNFFDFNGGGYTTDGACSSSLLAVTTAIKDIRLGHIDMALAGGVDISLDPFELVGFSRAGALTRSSMNVFSKNSKGFIPSEGCGFVVLMEAELARSKGLEIYALVNGYGISSDGSGGLTRPKATTQAQAISKAYPENSIQKLKYVEAHGTGTTIGDETELSALIKVTTGNTKKVKVGALKELIGHSKAASGIAGLIKTILITKNRFIPAQHTNKNKHQLLENTHSLDVVSSNETISEKEFATGVSSFGFGGINVHVSLKNDEYKTPKNNTISKYQDTELLLFTGINREAVQTQVANILEYSHKLSIAEISDLSYHLYQKLDFSLPVKLAITASHSTELTERLNTWLENSDQPSGYLPFISWGSEKKKLNLGFLFPGQGTSTAVELPVYSNRHPNVTNILAAFNLPNIANPLDPETIQPTVVRNSAIALSILQEYGIEAHIGIGHSLGELSALYWSGVLSIAQLNKLSHERGTIMKNHCTHNGTMFNIEADVDTVLNLISGYQIDIACKNALQQTVVAGSEEEFLKIFSDQTELKYTKLNVSHPFHSSLMNSGVNHFETVVNQLSFNKPLKTIYSPTTANQLNHTDEVKKMLTDQFTKPVLFRDSILRANDKVDVWVEVGSGSTLSRMASKNTDKPIFSTDLSNTLEGIHNLIGYLFANHTPIKLDLLFKDRFFRKFPDPYTVSFIKNPCEAIGTHYELETTEEEVTQKLNSHLPSTTVSPLKILREAIAKKLDLPLKSITPELRMLDDLHLNSIVVANLLAELTLKKGYATKGNPTEFSNASVQEIADALERIIPENEPLKSNTQWIRAFRPTWELSKLTSEIYKPLVSWKTLLEKPIAYDASNKILIIQLLACKETQVLQRLETMVKMVQINMPEKVVVIQDNPWASGWAKSFFQEHEFTRTVVIETDSLKVIEHVIEHELARDKGFNYIKYQQGHRYEQFLTPVTPEYSTPVITKEDLVLVTGGAKGITAECAIKLGEKFRNKTVILGRSTPSSEGVTTLLNRYKNLGLDCYYYSCDVSSCHELSTVMNEIQEQIGPINYLLHGAGINNPIPFKDLSRKSIEKTLAPKYEGLKNLLQVNYKALKAVFTFGSIIEYSGMKGNADYALANEWMNNQLQKYAKSHGVRCLNFAWSVWSGTGMGDRLGVLNSMRRQHIQPIGIEEGTSWFINSLNSELDNTVIISGKFGTSETLQLYKKERPQLRLLSKLISWYPEIELIAEIGLELDQHLYLKNHIINGACILPTVMAIEAMTEALTMLTELKTPIVLENLQLHQPVIIPEQGVKIHLEALKNENEITIRIINPISGLNYMQATVAYSKQQVQLITPVDRTITLDAAPIYDSLLFHKGQFKCLSTYHHLTPFTALASVNPTNQQWFSNELITNFITGHPGVNDAMLHLIQACVPHHKLLPHAFGKIIITQAAQEFQGTTIQATENYHKEDIYSYDISLISSNGKIILQYLDAQFKIVQSEKNVYPEITDRLLQISILRILTVQHLNEVKFYTNNEIPSVIYRGDGKPIIDEGYISITHCGNTKFAASFTENIGVDIEQVVERPVAIWERMLKGVHYKSTLKETSDIYYTRLWTIAEGLRKIGYLDHPNLELQSTDASGGLVYKNESLKVISWVYQNHKDNQLYAIAIVVELPKKPEPFKYKHIVSFEETNLVGNVYFSNFIKWQGLCREAFLFNHVQQISDESSKMIPISTLLSSGKLALVTLNTACNYLKELKAFDKISIHLHLEGVNNNRIKMKFLYYIEHETAKEELIAEGSQEIACMERDDSGGMNVYKDQIPYELFVALKPYLYE